jgi:hypothetical protein
MKQDYHAQTCESAHVLKISHKTRKFLLTNRKYYCILISVV